MQGGAGGCRKVPLISVVLDDVPQVMFSVIEQ